MVAKVDGARKRVSDQRQRLEEVRDGGFRRPDRGGHRGRDGDGTRTGSSTRAAGLQRRDVRCLRPGMAETKRLCEADGRAAGACGSRCMSPMCRTKRRCSGFAMRWRRCRGPTIHLLFNNAGIGGGGSMIASAREEWERTFNVCWGGVYVSTRAFLPMLMNADEGTSSIPAASTASGPRSARACRILPIRRRSSR